MLSFVLQRASPPLVHLDPAHQAGAHTKQLLSHQSDQDHAADGAGHLKGAAAPGAATAAASLSPRLQPVPQNTVVYLGETCVFHITLGNQGSTTITTIHIKVECSVEGGSCTALYDSSASPLPQLPPMSRHEIVVSTDIREAGQISLVASAVFTDHLGERKYHVQFFKLLSASPLSVRTRVRSLPHIAQPGRHPGTRCLLEVGVENSMQLPLVLHAVNLLPAAGIAAQQLALCEPLGQQQQQQQQQIVGGMFDKKQLQQYRQAAAIQDGGADTAPQHDLDGDLAGLALGSSSSSGGSDAAKQQQQQQTPPPVVGDGGQRLVVVPPAFSHNCLFQVDHIMPGSSSSSSVGGGASTPTAAGGGSSSSGGGSGSSAVLGRLELHWSSFDGKTGKLLTQPLSGPVPASGREVLLQLTELRPPQQQQQPPPLLANELALGQPLLAVLSLTAAGGPGHAGAGPLLVLFTDLSPTPAPAAASGSTSSAGGSVSQQQQQPQPRQQQGRSSSGFGGAIPDMAVQGSRSRRLQRLAAGETVTVSFELLPLRRGWVRLPTFVVVSEADGRLLDSVHDVQVMVC